jgi:hypothetical protein
MADPRVFVGMSTRGYAYGPSVVAGVTLARQYGTVTSRTVWIC